MLTTDQRVVAKQEIQEVESANRAGAPYAHHRNQARDANTKLRQQLGFGRCSPSTTSTTPRTSPFPSPRRPLVSV